jgi:hypothetical protein
LANGSEGIVDRARSDPVPTGARCTIDLAHTKESTLVITLFCWERAAGESIFAVDESHFVFEICHLSGPLG